MEVAKQSVGTEKLFLTETGTQLSTVPLENWKELKEQRQQLKLAVEVSKPATK